MDNLPTLPASLPVVRLRSNKSPKRIRFGYPWAYIDELVLDRRTRAIAPGSVVQLEDSDRNPLGLAAFNASSKIACRILDRNVDAVIDENWIKSRIFRALATRKRLYDSPYYRLVHAESDGLPGLIIDRFGTVAAIQPNSAWSDNNLDAIAAALTEECGIETIVMNGAGRAREIEGLAQEVSVFKGQLDAPLEVPMNGATYLADLIGGQKTGIFYDQRDNHAFAARLAKDADVLDVFSHVGGFALAALAKGAKSALCIDGSQAALDLATQGAKATGVEAHLSTTKADAFDAMQSLAAEGRKFGLVICDPPAFAPNRNALAAGLRAYERVARLGATLVAPGGYLGLCSCSHAATSELFAEASTRGIGKAHRAGPLLYRGAAGPDHPVHPALAETGYLKTLFFRLD